MSLRTLRVGGVAVLLAAVLTGSVSGAVWAVAPDGGESEQVPEQGSVGELDVLGSAADVQNDGAETETGTGVDAQGDGVEPATESSDKSEQGPVQSASDPLLAKVLDRECEATVTPLEAKPGDTIHVTGVTTWLGGPAKASFFFWYTTDESLEYGEDLNFYPKVDSQGRFDEDYVIPSDALPGEYDLGFMCSYADMGLGLVDFKFRVLGKIPKPIDPIVDPLDPTTHTETLAETGAGTLGSVLALSGGLAAAGAGLLARRRRAV